ncbi:MAG: 1,2-phenylacetyl-CoA epoxidase subunit PaaD [Burkholderiaceae bacterium]
MPSGHALSDRVAQVWQILDTVTDPEIPVVSLKELGILREVREDADGLVVVITPTYSGCPAMHQIEDDIKAALAGRGIAARVVTQLAPAWTTDWMTEEAKQKLRVYGIAPPLSADQVDGAGQGSAKAVAMIRLQPRRRAYEPAQSLAPICCPHCGSDNTTETSHFGSTACKALYRCLDCREPFDYFKPF